MLVKESACIGLIIVCTVAIYFTQCGRKNPSDAAEKVYIAFKRRDWKALYEMSSSHEQKILGWNAAKFSKLMEFVAQKGALPILRFQNEGGPPDAPAVVYRLFFEKEAIKKSFAITLRLDRDNEWKLDIGDLPYLYVRAIDANWATRFYYLAEGMTSAEITKLYSQLKNQVLSVDDVRQAALEGTGIAKWRPKNL